MLDSGILSAEVLVMEFSSQKRTAVNYWFKTLKKSGMERLVSGSLQNQIVRSLVGFHY